MDDGLDARYSGNILKRTIYRKHIKNDLTFSANLMRFTENFYASFSHERWFMEKNPLLYRMLVDEMAQFLP